MSRFKKIISVVLSFSILLSVAALDFSFTVSAATIKIAMVDATSVNLRKTPSASGEKLDSISRREVTVLGDSSAEWLNVTYIKDGKQYTGYIKNNSDYIYVTEYNYEDSFETQLAKFPESYRRALTELHSKYPNWNFIPDFVNSSFEDAVKLQESGKQTTGGISWRTMGQGSYDWTTDKWVEDNGGWYYASREVIAYYMDPRNFLNSTEIYMFLKQGYEYGSYTEEGLGKIVAGTFLEKGYSDPENKEGYNGSYIKLLMEAGKQSGISPYVLASAIIQEQGSCIDKKTGKVVLNSLISGEHECYNFFNYGASGATKDLVIKNGVAEAKKQGWTTRSASIIGGAKKYKNGYIGIGQDTYYLQDYNVHFPQKGLYHQYAQAVHDARGKGFSMSKLYSEVTDSSLTFRIPVYTSIPSTPSPKPDDNNNYNNYYFKNISVNGLVNSFNMFEYNYNLHISDDTIIDVTIPDTAVYASNTEFALNQGNNVVMLTVQSQSGYTNSYTINVNADKACTLYINKIISSMVGGPYKNGDVNGDGKISAGDMANIRLHLLGKYTLGGANFTAADINKDGKISAGDLANVRLHLLGKYTIKG